MITDAIYSILSGDAALTAVVSTRIYPVFARQNETKPFLVFEISQDGEYTKDGAAKVIYTDLDIYIIATGSPRATMVIADLIKDALDQYSGVIGDNDIDLIQWTATDDNIYNPDRKEYQLSMGFTIREK